VPHAMGIDPAIRLSPDGFTLPASTGQVVNLETLSFELKSV